ncbi:hypothetical protein KUF71_004741 [Frankliniella fusca]|uniref:Uncharacterized protein n=1 Tax=Frankliniella fusca TaxID=407009 RepID=A0AAE1H0L4_9NEOP|nr:hypothetical protein KUF71_004741 [Frankliniella fusca]
MCDSYSWKLAAVRDNLALLLIFAAAFVSSTTTITSTVVDGSNPHIRSKRHLHHLTLLNKGRRHWGRQGIAENGSVNGTGVVVGNASESQEGSYGGEPGGGIGGSYGRNGGTPSSSSGNAAGARYPNIAGPAVDSGNYPENNPNFSGNGGTSASASWGPSAGGNPAQQGYSGVSYTDGYAESGYGSGRGGQGWNTEYEGGTGQNTGTGGSGNIYYDRSNYNTGLSQGSGFGENRGSGDTQAGYMGRLTSGRGLVDRSGGNNARFSNTLPSYEGCSCSHNQGFGVNPGYEGSGAAQQIPYLSGSYPVGNNENFPDSNVIRHSATTARIPNTVGSSGAKLSTGDFNVQRLGSGTRQEVSVPTRPRPQQAMGNSGSSTGISKIPQPPNDAGFPSSQANYPPASRLNVNRPSGYPDSSMEGREGERFPIGGSPPTFLGRLSKNCSSRGNLPGTSSAGVGRIDRPSTSVGYSSVNGMGYQGMLSEGGGRGSGENVQNLPALPGLGPYSGESGYRPPNLPSQVYMEANTPYTPRPQGISGGALGSSVISGNFPRPPGVGNTFAGSMQNLPRPSRVAGGSTSISMMDGSASKLPGPPGTSGLSVSGNLPNLPTPPVLSGMPGGGGMVGGSGSNFPRPPVLSSPASFGGTLPRPPGLTSGLPLGGQLESSNGRRPSGAMSTPHYSGGVSGVKLRPPGSSLTEGSQQTASGIGISSGGIMPGIHGGNSLPSPPGLGGGNPQLGMAGGNLPHLQESSSSLGGSSSLPRPPSLGGGLSGVGGGVIGSSGLPRPPSLGTALSGMHGISGSSSNGAGGGLPHLSGVSGRPSGLPGSSGGSGGSGISGHLGDPVGVEGSILHQHHHHMAEIIKHKAEIAKTAVETAGSVISSAGQAGGAAGSLGSGGGLGPILVGGGGSGGVLGGSGGLGSALGVGGGPGAVLGGVSRQGGGGSPGTIHGGRPVSSIGSGGSNPISVLQSGSGIQPGKVLSGGGGGAGSILGGGGVTGSVLGGGGRLGSVLGS